MTQTFSLMRKLIENHSKDTKFEVFLKNGNKLTGTIDRVSDRTFVISNGSGHSSLRSLVYFSKVSSTTPLLSKPAHYSGLNTSVDDSIGNRKSPPTVVHKKPRNRLLRRDSGNDKILTPSDIEYERFHNSANLTGTNN